MFRNILRALRPYQWAKNLLVFLPLLAAHRLFGSEILPAALAFAALCAAASAGYVFNDLADAPADRQHRGKSRRPFASGALATRVGVSLIAALLAIAFAIVLRLPVAFRLVLLLYLALSGAYTLWLKRLTLIDVMTLALLYTVRLFAGSLATGVALTNWFLAFTTFLFLSLALVKRVGELRAATEQGTRASRRGYRSGDIDVLGRMGIAAGYLSVLVLALYINSSDVTHFYRRPEWLWALCALLLFWISRIWLITERGEMHDDPVLFALTDSGSYLVGLVAAAVVYYAT